MLGAPERFIALNLERHCVESGYDELGDTVTNGRRLDYVCRLMRRYTRTSRVRAYNTRYHSQRLLFQGPSVGRCGQNKPFDCISCLL